MKCRTEEVGLAWAEASAGAEGGAWVEAWDGGTRMFPPTPACMEQLPLTGKRRMRGKSPILHTVHPGAWLILDQRPLRKQCLLLHK